MLDLARTGLAALALGVSEEAIRRAAAYMNERNQFGHPLATFQGAKMRAADAWIDTEAMRVTLWEAAWRIDTGRPAADAVAVAKWWASEAGQRVVHATQHLHGGVGADISYPIHRFFLWGKQIELMLGTPPAELDELGSILARVLTPEATSGSGGARK
jgi:alkylation response protein AidB-like acyl-CoA dehydrogenase